MRVALVASSFAPHVGGVEEHVRKVAREFAADGLAVEVWTVARDGAHRRDVLDGVVVQYLPTPLPARNARSLATFAVASPSAWRHWMRAHREFRPDLLHVHCFGPNGLYALAQNLRKGVPLAITSHGETLGDDNNVYSQSALLRSGMRRALRRSVLVTAPSEFVLRNLRSEYGLVGGKVVPNGVDALEVDADDEAGFPSPYLLAVGRLGRMKGFDLLVDAFGVADLDHNTHLVIGGDGPEASALARQARERGLSARVHFPGRLSPHAVARAMSTALAVVVPSRSEAFGIVALEAWRSGAPLVMTNRGGAPEFVRHGADGVLIDPLDTTELAAALRDISADASMRRRLSLAGRLRVKDFTWAGVADQYRSQYRNVLASSPSTNGRSE